MSKLSHLTLALLFTLPILAGCSHLQDPSKEDTLTSPGPIQDNGRDTLNPINTQRDNNLFPTDGLLPRPSNGEISADLQDRINNGTLRPEDILVSIYFNFDKYNVTSEKVPAATGDQQAELVDVAKKLAANPKLHVIAVGHTDWFGSDEYNLALSDRRAKNVIEFTTKNGASPDAMQLLAKGKLQATPDVKDKESPQARHDRRVDIVIISK